MSAHARPDVSSGYPCEEAGRGSLCFEVFFAVGNFYSCWRVVCFSHSLPVRRVIGPAPSWSGA